MGYSIKENCRVPISKLTDSVKSDLDMVAKRLWRKWFLGDDNMSKRIILNETSYFGKGAIKEIIKWTSSTTFSKDFSHDW